MVVDIEITDKLGKNQKGVWHLGGVALVSIHYNEHNSVIFAPRSFKFCVVVDIEVTNKLENISKRGVALVSKHLNGHNSVIFEPRCFKYCVVVDII